MKISEHLDKSTKDKLNNVKKKRKCRNVESFTEKDILYLMGTNRDRYERRSGAVRRK